MKSDKFGGDILATDPLTEREIIDSCIRQTRIVYSRGNTFFRPRLRGINHLEVGRSKIISNPVTILIEWIYLLWTRLRDLLKVIMQHLFPRRNRLWCNRVDSHIVGRTIFAGDRGQGPPIHNLHLELWARTWLGAWRKLAVGTTDADGRFRLPFDLRQARRLWVRRVFFEIHTATRVYYEGDRPKFHFDLWSRQAISTWDLIGMDYNLRTIQLDFWNYLEGSLTPRAKVNADGDSPEHYSQGRIDALIEQVTPVELTKIMHLEQVEFEPGSLTIAQIQSDYPTNLTTCIERHLPGYTRGDDWFGERMMNGMNKGSFQPDAERPGHYWVRYFGKGWSSCNEIYAYPDAEIRFTIKENGLPKPEEIQLTGCLSIHDRDSWQKRIFTPADEPNWTYAKRVARVTGASNTEIEEHFAGTHLNSEQFAVAAFRNLRLSPVAALLLPHLKEVSLIDHTAEHSLIGGYIPSATALTKEGIDQRTRDILGLQDWKGWKPMTPLSPAHTYAQAETVFWDVVGTYVDAFIDDWATEIKAQWYEVYRFSEDLVTHAVPVAFTAPRDRPPEGAAWADLARRRFDYFCQQYSFDPALDRPVIAGERRALSRITAAKTFDEAAPEDWQNLKDACRYAIMMATYMHTWINEHQYDDLGEVLYSCGGLRFGEKPEGIMAPESDFDIAPDLMRSTQMLFFTNLLSRTEYGFITRNEEGDVNPRFASLLQERREEFMALGVDVDKIESRTNI